MLQVFPDYYKEFQCIAGECSHSCCIGWEIDIDPETAEIYRNLPGEMGERLRRHIAWEETPHFILGAGERCPFLNDRNLCDVILNLGEDHICGICTDHPRFRNELPGRLETGIGLCCEEAARLVLSREAPVILELQGEAETDDEIVDLRDEVIRVLQNRKLPIQKRLENMLVLCGSISSEKSLGEWAELLLGLEHLNDEWAELLLQLKDQWETVDFSGFDAYMSERQTEYEQFVIYLIYRHFANAFDALEVGARAAFAALGYTLLRGLGAVIWTETGAFSFHQQTELARLFSSELEYSEENMDILLGELYG